MYTVYAFPDNHTVHEVEDFIEARIMADELSESSWYAYVVDDSGDNIYQVERAWEFPWE